MRIRAIVNGVCFYTTSTAIKRRTVCDFSNQNIAMAQAYDLMGPNNGLATTITLYDNKMNSARYAIQLDKV